MGPAGESCSYQSHNRHHAGSPSDCGRWVECYTTAALFRASYSVWGGGTRLLLRHLVVPPNANVINVSNEVQCGETFRVFNLILLITTGYRYFSSVIDKCYFGTFQWWPPPYYQPHHKNVSHYFSMNASHYFSMNETHNNQASKIIQDMWLKMLYWGRYWPPNWICKTFFERFTSVYMATAWILFIAQLYMMYLSQVCIPISVCI